MHANFPTLASFVGLLLPLPLLPFRSHAQNLADLPSCAQTPALSAIGSTGCQSSDFKCLCKDNTFIDNALAGAEKQCPPGDLNSVTSFAKQLCGGVGVTLTISATATGSSSAVSSPSSSSTPISSTPATASTRPLSSATSDSTTTPSQSTAVAVATPSPKSAGATSGARGRVAGSGLRGIMMGSGAAIAVMGCWVLFDIGA